MKTRIFTTAAMMILAINLIAGTTNKNEKDSTAVLAYAPSDKSLFEIPAGKYDFNYEIFNSNTANVLENWISTRESWEQEGSEAGTVNILMESVNLEEWISGRESWEQGSEVKLTEQMEMVNLEEWIASRESWEQKGSKNEISHISRQSDILEAWISDRENWEQK